METRIFENEIHIGLEIERVLRHERRTVTWLSKKICCNRTNIYKLFMKRNIDVELLMRISLALEYNFFECYAQSVSNKLKVSTN